MRWIVIITAIAVLLSVASPDATVERRHASGIALLPPRDIGPFVRERERMGEAAFEPLAGTSSDARQLAEQEPDLFGIPFLDLAQRQVVVRLARPEAEQIARTWIASGYQRGDGTKPAPSLRPALAAVRLVTTTRSFHELQRIMNSSIDDPTLGIRGGPSRVWTIGIDDESQRVVFETDRVNDAFLFALARTYGTAAVAVRVDPRSGPFGRAPATLAPVSTVGSGALGLAAVLAVSSVVPVVALFVLWRRRRVT